MTRKSYKDLGVPVEQKELFRRWNLHRAQAKYRGEAHELEWADYRDIWINSPTPPGTHTGGTVLTRLDREQPWHRDNVALRTRHVDFFSNPRGTKLPRKRAAE